MGLAVLAAVLVISIPAWYGLVWLDRKIDLRGWLRG